MKVKGLQSIPVDHLPLILLEGVTQRTEVEIKYKLRATEYWGSGSAVRSEQETETSEEAYKTYLQLRKEYPKCKIDVTQFLSVNYGAGCPISPKRLRQIVSTSQNRPAKASPL